MRCSEYFPKNYEIGRFKFASSESEVSTYDITYLQDYTNVWNLNIKKLARMAASRLSC